MDSGGMGSVWSLIQLAVLRHCSSINWPAPPAQTKTRPSTAEETRPRLQDVVL